jgi:hypothetical protein
MICTQAALADEAVPAAAAAPPPQLWERLMHDDGAH